MCVLLIEDDLLIQQVMAEALRREGYEVEEASDGRSGIAMFEEYPERFVILITNFHLPGAYTGKDVADHVRRKRPELPVLVASGAQEAIAASWREGEHFSVLPKPYRAAELLRMVGAMIAKHGD